MELGEYEQGLRECPVCGRQTDSLKQYQLLARMWFLLFFHAHQTAICRACPECMRRFAWRLAWGNIVSANVSWPFVMLPQALWVGVSSRIPGHSADVVLGRTPAVVVHSERERSASFFRGFFAVLTILLWWAVPVGTVLAAITFHLAYHKPGWTRTVGKWGMIGGLVVVVLFAGLLVVDKFMQAGAGPR